MADYWDKWRQGVRGIMDEYPFYTDEYISTDELYKRAWKTLQGRIDAERIDSLLIKPEQTEQKEN